MTSLEDKIDCIKTVLSNSSDDIRILNRNLENINKTLKEMNETLMSMRHAVSNISTER